MILAVTATTLTFAQNVSDAQRYQREAEYYQRQAEYYKREADSYLMTLKDMKTMLHIICETTTIVVREIAIEMQQMPWIITKRNSMQPSVMPPQLRTI